MKKRTFGVVCRCLVVSTWIFASGAACQAMTLVREANTLFATGAVEDDFVKFREALDVPGLEQIVFVNSPGGDLWTGMRVARLIQEKNVNTVTAGYCVSACSILFMGGKARTFSDAFRPNLTYVGIHGPHSKVSKVVMSEQSPQIYAFFKNAMGERFNAVVMNAALYDMQDSGALLRVFDSVRLPKRVTYHCKSALSPRNECTDYAQADAFALGVVTAAELTKVNIPASMQTPNKLLGAPMDLPVSDMGSYLGSLADKTCTNDNCKKLVSNYANLKEHSAMALPLEGLGVGTVANQDSPNQALRAAVYVCNHVKDKPPRLCETVVVNDFDVKPFHRLARASHVEALAQVRLPQDKYFANEQFGGGFAEVNALRTDRAPELTPTKVAGVRVWGTQEMVLALQSARPPVLIDVAVTEEVIPSSLALVNGGVALDDSAKDAALELRILGLLKPLAPDLARPLIFVGLSREDWRPVNAALRARKLGYADIGWYRGGMAAWKAASLPSAKVVMQAVAN